MAVERDTEELLEHWGMWVVQGSGVSACQALDDKPTPIITDDEALLIDRLVGRLGQRYHEAAEVVLRYYTTGAPFAVVGRKMGFGEEKTRQLWKSGVAWIDGALEARRNQAA